MEAERRLKMSIGFSRMEKKYEWKDHVIFMVLLLGFAFWVNRGIEIKGLYMDDLYLWSCYGEQSFLQYAFPIGSARFRCLYYLAAWLEIFVIGSKVSWFVPFNILLNTAVAWWLYFTGRKLSRAKLVGFFCGILYLASPFAYYQIGQVLGLMETMALWMALEIFWCLYQYLNEDDRENRFYLACGLYTAVCFVHERYMVLLPLLIFALVVKKSRRLSQWAAVIGSFLFVQGVRLAAIGTVMPAGTGRTMVADTFSIPGTFAHGMEEVAYLFGINLGPEYLCGCPWSVTSFKAKILVAGAIAMVAIMVIGFLRKVMKGRKTNQGKRMLVNAVLFVLFIALCIGCSSVTFRVEMRWVYVSYGAALLFMAYLYGCLTDQVQIELYLKRIWPWGLVMAGYLILTLPVQLYYRSNGFPNLYLWPEQTRFNSLAEVTYEKYGEDLRGKNIYVLGNRFDVSEFDAETFFKVYAKKGEGKLANLIFIDDIWEIGLLDENMLVLKEDYKYNQYVDVTRFVRDMKVRVDYGYYDDGWMDEEGQITVIAGETGKINLEIIFPGVMNGGELITIQWPEGERIIPLESNVVHTQIQAEPWERVPLNFQYNFYMQSAQEQRGKDRLAAIVHMSVE